MHINRKIERFLIQYNYPTAKFGRDAVNDPRLVHDMRRGRTLGPKIAARAEAFIQAHAEAVAEQLEALA